MYSYENENKYERRVQMAGAATAVLLPLLPPEWQLQYEHRFIEENRELRATSCMEPRRVW